MNIISNIQKCNNRIVNMQQNKTTGCASPYDLTASSAAAATENLETGCIVAIVVNYEQLLRLLKVPLRRKIKPCLTALQNNSRAESSFLTQAEFVINKTLVTNCSKCNNQNNTDNCSSEMTTAKGDQPLYKKSGRYVYLNEKTCVEQDGVYYGHYFVPDKKGKLLEWFSFPAPAPRKISARVCCLLNSINVFIGDGNGVIRDFQIRCNPPKRGILGPLGLQCLKQRELEEPGPVLVLVKL